MTVRWDIAAVVIALLGIFAQVISVSPTTLRIFHRIFRKLLCLVWPQSGQCRRLVWDDIPPGLLHKCNPPALCPHHLSGSRHSTNCWDDTLGQTFTEAWKQLQPTPIDSRFLTQKPESLPFAEEYIQIDIKTLKAYLMLTMDLCRTFETDEMMTLLGVKLYGSIVTLHLKAPARASIPNNHALSSSEIDHFIEGYPPFYRQSFETTGGIKLGPSILNSDGIGRGSWVLAVGMSTSMGKPCAVHNMQRITQEIKSEFWKGTLPTAFRMIRRNLDYIGEYELSQIPEDTCIKYIAFKTGKILGPWTKKAVECYDIITSDEYSGQPWSLKVQLIEASSLFEGLIGDCPCQYSCIGKNPHTATCGRNMHTRKEPAKFLNQKACKAALEIFDGYRPSNKNLEIVTPKLLQILQTLILGLSEVEHYFSCLERKLELPKEWADLKYVYLRKCAGDVD